MVVFGTIEKQILPINKAVDCCESNKYMGRVWVLRISMKLCKLQERTAGSYGGLDKSRLCQKFGEEA